ncbi:MAG: substrate-binding domain-containing protein [Clostridiales bacterium]|nr:substrate-binding domain-containing protein [Clostridiales bacterium]
MKKIPATLIVLSIIFALFACGAKPAESPAPVTPSDAAVDTPTDAPVSEAPRNALELGFYDPSIDYDSAKRYKVAYIYFGESVVYDMLSAAFEAWSDRMNVEYSSFSAADAEKFLEKMQTYCDRGFAGLILDPDSVSYPAVIELANRNGIPWMSGMTSAYDESMKLLHPAVGYDNYAIGFDMFKWCVDYAKANWPESTPENTGGIFVGYSDLQMPELRHSGAYDAWLENGYKNQNFFFLDGKDSDMTAQTAQNLAASAMAAKPKITYWIGCGFFDDYSIGLARAAAAAGLSETTVCSTAGGTALIKQWEAGRTGSLKSAVCIEPHLYAEPIFCGLYAIMTGKAAAGTLWPRWIDRSSGERYADLRLPAMTITRDNYKEYLAFVDWYTELDAYPYRETAGTFPVVPDPPPITAAVPSAANTPSAAVSG